MVVVLTGSGMTVETGIVVSRLAVGRDTVMEGVGEGPTGAPFAIPVSTNVVVATSASLATALRPKCT